MVLWEREDMVEPAAESRAESLDEKLDRARRINHWALCKRYDDSQVPSLSVHTVLIKMYISLQLHMHIHVKICFPCSLYICFVLFLLFKKK